MKFLTDKELNELDQALTIITTPCDACDRDEGPGATCTCASYSDFEEFYDLAKTHVGALIHEIRAARRAAAEIAPCWLENQTLRAELDALREAVQKRNGWK